MVEEGIARPDGTFLEELDVDICASVGNFWVTTEHGISVLQPAVQEGVRSISTYSGTGPKFVIVVDEA